MFPLSHKAASVPNNGKIERKGRAMSTTGSGTLLATFGSWLLPIMGVIMGAASWFAKRQIDRIDRIERDYVKKSDLINFEKDLKSDMKAEVLRLHNRLDDFYRLLANHLDRQNGGGSL